MQNQNLISHLMKNVNDVPERTALKYKEDKEGWTNISWENLSKKVHFVSCALLEKKIQPGDKIAILSNSRFEWEIIDLGALNIGVISVPIYQTSQPEELEHILNDSGSKVLFCENTEQYEKWLKVKKNCELVKSIVIIDESSFSSKAVAFNEFLLQGEKEFSKNKSQIESYQKELNLQTIATIVYTSGTTGVPKGVILSHRQVMSELHDLFHLLEMTEKDITLLFLPLAHIMGRVEMWGHVYKRYTLAYAESIERVRDNLLEIRPTVLIAVPRIFEKIYNGILTQIESSSKKEKVFNWAISVGQQVSHYKQNREPIPFSLIAEYKVAQKLVFNKVFEKLGGRLRFAVSGGAPLNAHIAEFFHAVGLLLLEGYGLTETTAAICINSPIDYKFGTVGKPLGDVEIKLAEDGELLVKSNKVMLGYHNLKSSTEAVLKDGYFHTGDIGLIDEMGFVKITDRKKDLIKTSGGKYVAPQKIEALFKKHNLITNVLIHGDQKKFIVALLTMDQERVSNWALQNGISFGSYASLVKQEKVRELVRQVVADVNSNLANYESVKAFDILEHEFTVENGELTPSLKIKRKHCDEKFKEVIAKLYGTDLSGL